LSFNGTVVEGKRLTVPPYVDRPFSAAPHRVQVYGTSRRDIPPRTNLELTLSKIDLLNFPIFSPFLFYHFSAPIPFFDHPHPPPFFLPRYAPRAPPFSPNFESTSYKLKDWGVPSTFPLVRISALFLLPDLLLYF